jgi:hypothetical protein
MRSAFFENLSELAKVNVGIPATSADGTLRAEWVKDIGPLVPPRPDVHNTVLPFLMCPQGILLTQRPAITRNKTSEADTNYMQRSCTRQQTASIFDKERRH